MKEFLDMLQLNDPSAKGFKATVNAIKIFFQAEANQNLLVANIEALMGVRNLGVEDLSKAAGKNRSYIGRLLRKDFQNFNPSVATIRSIADALGVKPSTLVMADIRQEFNNLLKDIEQKKETTNE